MDRKPRATALAVAALILAAVAPTLAAATSTGEAPGVLHGVAARTNRLVVNCGGSATMSDDGPSVGGVSCGSSGGVTFSLNGFFHTGFNVTLSSVDAPSGNLTALANATVEPGVLWGVSTADHDGERIFLVDSDQRLVVHEGATGTTRTTAPMPHEPISMEYDAGTNTLYALAYSDDNLTLFTVDADTGGMNPAVVVREGGTVSWGVSAFDPDTRSYYYVGSGQVTTGLQRIDVDLGLLVSPPNPIFFSPPARSYKALEYHDGWIYGLMPRSGGFAVQPFDPATGLAYAPVATFPDTPRVHWAVSTLDPSAGTFAFVGEDANHTARVHTAAISQATGSVGEPLDETLAALEFIAS